MYEKKDYRTLRTFARLTSGFGWAVAGIFFLIGFVGGIQAQGVLTGILSGFLFGFGFGLAFILSGQVVSVFLDLKELLEEILAAQPQEPR
jgi:hypothetical protein